MADTRRHRQQNLSKVSTALIAGIPALAILALIGLMACTRVNFTAKGNDGGLGVTGGPTTTNPGSSTTSTTLGGSHNPNLVARDDGPYDVVQGQSLFLTDQMLLSNDTSTAGGMKITAWSQPSLGSLLRQTNQFEFVAGMSELGSVVFNYTVTDSSGLTAAANITVNIRARAKEKIYSQTGKTLFRFDLTTYNAVKIADFTLDGAPHDITDIAINNAGLMYAVDGKQILSLEPTTGVLQPYRALDASAGNVVGLTFWTENKLIIGGAGVYVVDLQKNEISTLVQPGKYATAGDLLVTPSGQLLWTTYTDELVKIDLSTGATNSLGKTAIGAIWGLGWVDGRLIGFANSGQAFDIDPSSAQLSNIVQLSYGSWWGAATNPYLW